MLDAAAVTLATFWDDLTHDGNTVVSISVKYIKEENFHNDHKQVEKLVNASLKDLRCSNNELKVFREELAFFC